MVLRMSTLFLRTLREDPADAEVASHKLLVRAGYVRRTAPGIYTWLPLGYRVLRRVERIIREEMDALGAQEVHFPALLPRELYEATGRVDAYGDTLFNLADRKGAPYVLGPTHEELFTLLVKGEYSSYKDYPVTLYQIQNKYRDEARPRAGILRGREFVMKDSYSFDLDDDGLAASYAAHRDAYARTFDRLGLDYRIVSAVSGAMGGSASEEFLAVCDAGEDTFVQCENCDYAANTEAVDIAVPAVADGSATGPVREIDTPGAVTIEGLVSQLQTLEPARGYSAADTLKNVVLKTKDPGDDEWRLLVVGIPGDREVDFKRIAGQLEPVEVAQADGADVARVPALVRGFIGPRGLAAAGIRYFVDPLVAEGTAWVTGADAEDKHLADVVRGRDFTPDGEIGAVEIRDGDRCARCGGRLLISRGIEVGHIFALGRKYTDAFSLDALGPDSKPIRITMGSYGMGVSRVVAAIAEQHHDDAGLVWPREIAPVDVHIVVAGKDEQLAAAKSLAESLEVAGLSVLLDDRTGVSVGVKFADAELIGVPRVVVVGRGLANGVVEFRDRAAGSRDDVPMVGAVAALIE